ncbi:rhamnulokinase [Anaerocolumna cellulosilytica]|nr:rhamnulokinase family protein [Anaerocolumna cellulosilytica]
MLGTFDGDTIKIEEIHRFLNDPVVINKTMYWDILRLFYELKQGLIKAGLKHKIDSIAVDTWGVDFGLLDKAGYLLENPVHYRDKRTEGMLEKALEDISREELYESTGNQFMEINTVFQVLSLTKFRKELLDRADTLLLIPDLMNYFFTGVKVTEYSIASTTQLLNAKERTWDVKLMKALGIPDKLFTTIVPSATWIGKLSPDICKELKVEECEVIAVAGHDTQCALAAVPAKEEDFIFLSCGTWSLMGTELEKPLINEKSNRYNITNEGGYGGRASFLKNITGLWMIQESRRWWIKEGREYSFGELEKMAKESQPFLCFVDPDSEEFSQTGNMPDKIREYCRRTGQEVPEGIGAIVRCINESLALKYRLVLDEIKECTKQDYKALYMVGGGIQSKLLCQFTSDACNLKVIAGPVEATVYGNVVLQLIAAGAVKDLKEAREIIRKSEEPAAYEPAGEKEWELALVRFKELLS